MTLKHISNVIEHINSECDFATESEFTSYIDSQTNEAVIELTTEYNSIDRNAIEIEQELQSIARNLDLDMQINHIGFTKFEVQFRTAEWTNQT